MLLCHEDSSCTRASQATKRCKERIGQTSVAETRGEKKRKAEQTEQTGAQSYPRKMNKDKQQTIDKRSCLPMWNCGMGWMDGRGGPHKKDGGASEATESNVSGLGRGQRKKGAHCCAMADWEFEARKTKEKPRERRRAKA